jgi:hypothetical protein
MIILATPAPTDKEPARPARRALIATVGDRAPRCQWRGALASNRVPWPAAPSRSERSDFGANNFSATHGNGCFKFNALRNRLRRDDLHLPPRRGRRAPPCFRRGNRDSCRTSPMAGVSSWRSARPGTRMQRQPGSTTGATMTKT